MRTHAIQNNGQNLTSSIVASGYLGVFELMTLPESTGTRIYGFFKAPATGDHIFYLTADDVAEVWINLQPNITTLSTQTRILNVSEWKNLRDTWTKTIKSNEKLKSSPIPLQKDQYYYIEAYVYNGGSQGHISVIIPGESPCL